MPTNNTTTLPTVKTQLLIGGQWVSASQNATFEVTDPATLGVIATVSDADPSDAIQAVDAAHKAQAMMAATTPQQRCDFLSELYAQVVHRADEFAALITAESGKPLAEARAEVSYGADYVRWFAQEALRVSGEVRDGPAGHVISVHHKPVGPSYLITPWNFPLAMATRKIAPAIAAGCTVIVKPASATPLTTLYFVQLAQELVVKHKLPQGVLNAVPSSHSGEISNAILADSRLRKVSFTGSTPVGVTLLRSAAQNILRTSMELGGNAPFIVCEDADIDAAVEGAMAAKMRNSGQTCVAANRFIVHATRADEFTEKLKREFENLIIAPGTVAGSTAGPLISAEAVARVEELVKASLEHGAQLVYRAGALPQHGHFSAPTIVRTTADDPILAEEIFGPVAPIVTFEALEEAIDLANDTPFGLVAYAYTGSTEARSLLMQQLQTGMLGINRGMVSDASAPFGGIKQSGLGREGGHQGIMEYLEPFYVAEE